MAGQRFLFEGTAARCAEAVEDGMEGPAAGKRQASGGPPRTRRANHLPPDPPFPKRLLFFSKALLFFLC